jgi:hypothetical protein
MTTPDPTTPEQELASAYLDGDATAGERARVDRSPELQAAVASLRHNATLVAAAPPASSAVREAAIAAALAEFDSLHSSNSAVSLPVSIASYRRWPTRVLAAAAAIVLVGVVGISVLRNTDEHKSESASLATDSKRAGTEDAVAGAQPATGNGQTVLAASVAAIEINDPQDLLTLTAPTPPSADSSPVADTTAIAGETSPSPTAFESYNVDALACMSDTQEFLADIYYRGTIAIAVRDTVTGVTEAIDSNCTVLARVNP